MFVFVDESRGFETPLKMHKMRNKKQPVADAGAVAGPLDRISSYDAKQSEIEVKYADAIQLRTVCSCDACVSSENMIS